VYEVNDKDTLEVPYIASSYNWDIYDRAYFKGLRIIDKSYDKENYSYATLVNDTNIIYNSVYLNFNSSDFFKEISLEGSDDNKKWKTIIENEKLFHYYREPGDHYYRNKIVFEPVSFKYLRLKINDKNSSRLELISASIPLIKEEYNGDGEPVDAKLTRTENKKDKQTILECDFNRKYSIKGLKLNIENEEHYRRHARIEFYNDHPNLKDKWVFFGEGTLSSVSSNKMYLSNYSGNSDFKSEKMRIIIENQDNRPLEKIQVKAFTHEEIINLKLKKDKKYVLAYGRANDAAPQYDLEYFKYTIPLNLSKADLGVENKITQPDVVKQQPLIGNKKWIWGALIGCGLLIGIFAIRLLKTGSGEA